MKFGGTSVGVPRHFRVAVQEVVRRRRQAPVVVVSALSGVTNLLAEFCAASDRRREIGPALIDRHVQFALETGIDRSVFCEALGALRDDLEAQPPGKPSPADRDRILSHGEQIAATLFAAGLRTAGIEATAVVAGDAGLVTDDRFGAAHPLPESSAKLRACLAARTDVAVVTGFLGRTTDGRTTTLGRGGSDYSAALIAAALGAEEIQIWTDTSGMLSADPRIVPEARTVPRLSFAEASELAYFGAKVPVARDRARDRRTHPQHHAARRSRVTHRADPRSRCIIVAGEVDRLQEGHHSRHDCLDTHAARSRVPRARFRSVRAAPCGRGSGHHVGSLDLGDRR